MRRGAQTAGVLAAILLATALAYLPSIDGEFILDDEEIRLDDLVRSPTAHGPSEWLRSARPVASLTFALNRLAVGEDTRGFHVTNLCIHLVAILLAWAVARLSLERAGLRDGARPALAAAAIFALHPLQTEAVAYVVQRAESLAGAIFLAALFLLLRRDEERAPARRATLLAGAAALQALGALTKPTVATLPAAWLLHAALIPAPGEEPLGPLGRVRARLAAAAPLFALTAASAFRELSSTGGVSHVGLEVPHLPPAAYLATELRVVPTYLRLALWPSGLCGDRVFRVSAGFLEPGVVLGGLLLLAVIAGALTLAARVRGRPGDGPAAVRVAAFGVLFFLLALLPSSSLVPLHDPIAERRVYLGMLGLALAAVAAATWALRTRVQAAGRVGWIAGVAVCVLLAGATANRAGVWRSAEAFWQDVERKGSCKARCHLSLGLIEAEGGRHREALLRYEQAARLVEDHTVPDAILTADVVDSLTALGRVDEARQAVLAALDRAPVDAELLGLLARVEFVARRPDGMEFAAALALAADPKAATALKTLGMARARQGDWAAARELLRRAAAARPTDTQVQWELGLVDEALGDREGACAALLRAANEPGPRAMATAAAARFGALCR